MRQVSPVHGAPVQQAKRPVNGPDKPCWEDTLPGVNAGPNTGYAGNARKEPVRLSEPCCIRSYDNEKTVFLGLIT